MINVIPVKTRIFTAGENLAQFIVDSVPRERVHERMVVAVTSKIVSLAEMRLVARDAMGKTELVKRESDRFYGEIGHGCFLTVKHGLLIASAGIDESNSAGGDYILYPEDPYRSARELWTQLRELWNVKELGVVLTDSRTMPLRRGVTGISLSYWGFKALRNLVGQPDLFGREMRMTQMNLADGIAGAAVMMMGEAAEQTPVALVEGMRLEFTPMIAPEDIGIPYEEDLYYPVLKACEERV
jgi:F420-0:gamma-glutamyl ligase